MEVCSSRSDGHKGGGVGESEISRERDSRERMPPVSVSVSVNVNGVRGRVGGLLLRIHSRGRGQRLL